MLFKAEYTLSRVSECPNAERYLGKRRLIFGGGAVGGGGGGGSQTRSAADPETIIMYHN